MKQHCLLQILFHCKVIWRNELRDCTTLRNSTFRLSRSFFLANLPNSQTRSGFTLRYIRWLWAITCILSSQHPHVILARFNYEIDHQLAFILNFMVQLSEIYGFFGVGSFIFNFCLDAAVFLLLLLLLLFISSYFVLYIKCKIHYVLFMLYFGPFWKQFVNFNPWKVLWNWIACLKKILFISPG